MFFPPFNDEFINVWSWTVINSTLFYKGKFGFDLGLEFYLVFG
jgi:hypothetical protein